MKIQRFTKDVCRSFSPKVVEALEKLGEEHGCSVKYRGGELSETKYTIKIEFSVLDTAAGISGARQEFEQRCQMYNLKSEDFQRHVNIDGQVYRIAGIRPSSYKYPILLDRLDGKRFKFSASRVANACGYTPTEQTQWSPYGGR